MKITFRKLLILIAMCIILPFSGKSQPYPKCGPYPGLTPLENFDQLHYNYPVKHQVLGANTDIAYIDEGKGEQTIIFIHGLGSYLPAWNKNVAALKDHYRVIAIDLPGYGKSSKLPHSGRMSYYAGAVAAFIRAQNLENVYLAGHSMGGQIAMTAALNHPELVKGLILIAPAGFERFNEGQKQWFREVMTVDGVMKTPAEDIINNLAVNFYNMPDDAEFMITDRLAMRSATDFEAYCYAVVQSVHGMVDEPVIEMLPQITQPTLIIFGEKDNLIPNRFLNPGFTRKIAEFGHSKIKNSQLVMVEKAGHFVQFEKPEEVNKAIRAFIR